MKYYSLILINTNTKRYKRITKKLKAIKRKAKDKRKANKEKDKDEDKDEDININNNLIS